MSLSWEPIRRGDTYCSEACGGKCLWSEYNEANANAKALAKRLGPWWIPHVWENLGWHWEVINGPLRVDLDRFSNGKSYCCMLASHYTWFGSPQHRKTPEQAIAAMVCQLLVVTDEIFTTRSNAIKAASLTLKGKRDYATLQRGLKRYGVWMIPD